MPPGRGAQRPTSVCSLPHLLAVLTLLSLVALGTPTAKAQQYDAQEGLGHASLSGLKTTAGIGLSGTYSDNVNLASGSNKQSDFYTSISPRIGMTYNGPRLTFAGTYSPTAVVYANNSDFNSWYNALNATSTLTAIDNLFYIDAAVNISQQYLSSFAPVPVDLGTTTANRFESRVYSLSPYFKGTTNSGVSYELRERNTWANANTSTVSNSQFQEWSATANKAVGVYSVGADYDRQETNYAAQNSLVTSVSRLRLGYQVNPELRLTLRGGYTTNNYFVNQQSGVLYGAGLDATPTPRTSVSGYWEHQFYGDSYSLTASHRRRLTAFTLSASRQLSTYPQALLSIPSGNTSALLDAALTARIPDPVQRQAFVNQFMQQTGLPSFLTSPYAYNTNTVSLVNQVTGSIALLGVHNSMVFSAYHSSSENVGQPGVTVPPSLLLNSNFTSDGGSANYTHNISPKSTLEVTLSRIYTNSNQQSNTDTTQDLVRLMITNRLGVKTTGSIGVRYQHITSTVVPTAIEHAIFATLDHNF